MARNSRDHGGGLDGAVATYGGSKSDWVDLSTGINPKPFPVADIPQSAWEALPDETADAALCQAARAFWNVPEGAAILAVPGCSSAIAQIPYLYPAGKAGIAGPTYNEHAASFAQAGWAVSDAGKDAAVIVHPNNPTGAFHHTAPDTALTIIDESFCDIAPDNSMIQYATQSGHLVLKSFGKFWGLAGLRLGFVIGDPALIAQLKARLGPWPVSGPAMEIGTQALTDQAWANDTRAWLNGQIAKLDAVMLGEPMGQVPLFRTYKVADAKAMQHQLAQAQIWTRIFPYSDTWIRLGVPTDAALERLKDAL